MDLIVFEDSIRYDPWIKVVLTLSVVLLLVIGCFFYIDGYNADIFPRESASESRFGAIVLFASAVFVLVIYWLILPRAIVVTQDAIVLRFNAFNWNIPFGTINSIKAARGIIVFWAHSWITSYGTQIEIRRRCRLKIRVSPARRDQFLEYANKALAYWRNTHPV